MKKVFIFIVIMLLAVGAFSVTAFAQDVTEEGGEAVALPVEDNAETAPPAEDTEDGKLPADEDAGEGNYFDRILEYIESGDIFELLGLAAALIMLLFAYLIKRGLVKVMDKLVLGNKSTSEKMQGVKDDSLKAIEMLKESMMSALEDINERIKESAVTREEIEHIVGAIMDMAEMFETVYQGSSTIPAPIKERLAATYNHVKGLLEAGDGE